MPASQGVNRERLEVSATPALGYRLAASHYLSTFMLCHPSLKTLRCLLASFAWQPYAAKTVLGNVVLCCATLFAGTALCFSH